MAENCPCEKGALLPLEAMERRKESAKKGLPQKGGSSVFGVFARVQLLSLLSEREKRRKPGNVAGLSHPPRSPLLYVPSLPIFPPGATSALAEDRKEKLAGMRLERKQTHVSLRSITEIWT